MPVDMWTVTLTGQAKKAPHNLSKHAFCAFGLLLEQMHLKGPYRYDWPNFSKLSSGEYHCHIEKGRPTYVACWRVDKFNKIIEVYYAGTHEKAPY
jgi:hypothetical protein